LISNTAAFSYTPTGLGTIPVTITATVENASPMLSVSQSFQITVTAPPPPDIFLPPLPDAFHAMAGSPWTVSGSYFSDISGVNRASVDFGDGTAATPVSLVPPAAFTLVHTYASPGTYSMTVSMSGPFGNTGTATATVTFAASDGGGGFGQGGGSSGVQVTSITTTVAKEAITAFDVWFNGFVRDAADPSNYGLLLVTTRKVKKKLVMTTKRLGVKSVSFDASADVARIIPARRLVRGKVNELTINTAALVDSSGRPLGNGLIADIRGTTVTIR
jgi:PKD domain